MGIQNTISTSYGQEAVVPLHFQQQTPIIAEILHVDVEQGRKDELLQISKLEEYRLIAIQHQEIQKQQQKAWHDRNFKNKKLLGGRPCLTIQQSGKRKTQKAKYRMDGTLCFRRDTYQWISLTKDVTRHSISETC